MKVRRYVPAAIAVLLLLSAAVAWFVWIGYLAQEIAYADYVGTPGSESGLNQPAFPTSQAFITALLSEALGVGIASWLLIAKAQPAWVRLCFAFVLAAILDLFTYLVLTGQL
jgi:hypothetical protein